MGKKAEKKRLHKKRSSKSFLVFDEDARKEWLTSFSKRKKERQEKAKEDLAALLKSEKVRQRDEFRENVKKNEAKYLEKMKDVEQILKEKTQAYECGDKTVEITEYNLCDEEGMIGAHKESVGEEQEEEEQAADSDHNETSEPTGEVVPGAKMPKKMSKVAVKIEKRLYKLNHKRKISKHAANKKKDLLKAAGKPIGKSGKNSAKVKSGRKKR